MLRVKRLPTSITSTKMWPVVAVLVFAVVGTYFLVNSHAATPAASFEAENGSVASGATKLADSGASGGQAVKFSAAATSGFVHPGVFVGRAQLDFVKAKIAAGEQPWTNAYSTAKAKSPASLSYVPKPVPVIQCSPSQPQQNCTDQQDAAVAAYTDALLWYYSGNVAYANKAIEIMNAYANTTTSFAFDTSVYTNGLLEAAWGAQNFARAAEIIRYSNAGWSAADISKFETLLKNAYLPRVINGWTNGGANWQLSMADATIGIGVFTNDRATFDNGISDWRLQVPSAFYMETDTNPTYPNLIGKKAPIPPPNTNWAKPSITYDNMLSYWFGATTFMSGMEGETCRDISHTVFGFEAAANGAETARLQGIDLWGEQKTRLTKALETNAAWLNGSLDGEPQPADWPCNAALKLGGTAYKLGWEVMYNHYANRLGTPLPQTLEVINRIRPTGYGLHMDWETLTSAGTP